MKIALEEGKNLMRKIILVKQISDQGPMTL